MNFVGVKITAAEPLDQPIEEGIIFTINNIALTSQVEGDTSLWVETEGQSYCIATLRWSNPQYHTQVAFTDVQLKMTVSFAVRRLMKRLMLRL